MLLVLGLLVPGGSKQPVPITVVVFFAAAVEFLVLAGIRLP
jgi:hypothetical protein